MQNLLYHSTPIIGIKSLIPLSHFGTFAAALENYGRKFIDINVEARAKWRAHVLDHELLACRISCDAKSIGPIPDWSSPAPMALLSKICCLFPQIISNEEFEEFKVGCSCYETYDDSATEKLLSLFNVNNVHYVSYINHIEDRDSISVCVIDPSILIIEERLQFTFDQICSSVKKSILYTNSNKRNFADELLGLLQDRIKIK